jgi:DNA-binding response OmpR family regulator
MSARGRVLLIDKIGDALDALVAGLRARSWEVDVAGTVQAAIECAIRSQPEAVVTELTLPDVKAHHFARTMRSCVEHDLVVVGVAHAPDALATDAGCDAVFAKPIEIDQLAGYLARSIAGSHEG